VWGRLRIDGPEMGLFVDHGLTESVGEDGIPVRE
jgi:hypothetical protein